MLLATIPFTGNRPGGKILPTDTFQKELMELLRPPKCTCGHNANDECICMNARNKRRRKFVSMLERKGIPFENINSHRNCKGSATNAASGSTQAPPIVAICLRAGWHLAGVLNRYLSLENAGDQFVGQDCHCSPRNLRCSHHDSGGTLPRIRNY